MKYKVLIDKKNNTFPLKGLNELLGGRLYNFRTKKYHNPTKAENDKPIQCTFWIYAPNKRHDRGNLCSAAEKSFLDALQLAKVIKNDGWDDVIDSVFHTEVDKENPRVVVEIEVLERE